MDIQLERDFYSQSSKSALRAVFRSWTLDQCKHWLEQDLGLQLASEPGTAKWFPVSNSAKEVRNRLVAACKEQGVRFVVGAKVDDLAQQADGAWQCRLTDAMQPHLADRVVGTQLLLLWLIILSCTLSRLLLTSVQVLATGGLSFPVLGTDGLGHRIAERLGHALHPCYPALTPLTGSHPAGQQLAGGSPAQAKSRPVSNVTCILCCRCVPVCCTAGRLPQGQEEGPCPSGAISHAIYAQGLQWPRSPGPVSPCHHGFGEPDTASPRSAKFWQAPHLALEMHCTASTADCPSAAIRTNWLGQPLEHWQALLQQGGPASAQAVLRKAGLPQRLAEALCRRQAAIIHSCPS